MSDANKLFEEAVDQSAAFDQAQDQSEPKQSKNVLDVLLNKVKNVPSDVMEGVQNMLPSAETVEDAATGGLQGMTLGFADEGEGAAKTAGDVILGNKDLSDIATVYREYQKLAERRADEAKERSPYAYMGGELAGGLVTGLATAGGGLGIGASKLGVQAAAKLAGTGVAKEIGKRALASAGTGAILGGVTGAGTSKGTLGSQEQIADVLGSAAMGGVLAGGLTGAGEAAGVAAKGLGGKVGAYIEDSPLLRQMRKSREMGKEGTIISESEGAVDAMARSQTKDISGVTKNLENARTIMGQDIGQAIDNATTSGVKVAIKPEFDSTIDDLIQSLQNNKLAFGSTDLRNVMSELSVLKNKQGVVPELNPTELQSLKGKLFNLIGQTDNVELQGSLQRFKNGVDDALNEAVPGLKELNQKYSGFLKAGPEVLINKGQPTEITSKFLSALSDPKAKISEAVTELLSSLTTPGVGKQTSRRTFTELEDQLTKFEQANPGTLNRVLGINNAGEFTAKIKDLADKFAISRQALGYEPHGSPITNLQHGLLGSLSNTGRGVLVGGANLIGRTETAIAKSGPAKFSRSLYQAGDDTLNSVAGKLQNSGIPGLDSLGTALQKGLENKNQGMKNAALFTILQNPKARLLINPEELLNEEGKNTGNTEGKNPLYIDVFGKK